MQFQLPQLCTVLSSDSEFSILFNTFYLQKTQRALENVLAGTFLPWGSGLATPGLNYTVLIRRWFDIPSKPAQLFLTIDRFRL